jgi:hypothetical protein
MNTQPTHPTLICHLSGPLDDVGCFLDENPKVALSEQIERMRRAVLGLFIYSPHSFGHSGAWIMSSASDISTLYKEFSEALAEILAENVVGPARRGRLARARAAVKRQPRYNEHEYFLAVEAAFEMWEAKQTGR